MTAVLEEQTDKSQNTTSARRGRWIDEWESEDPSFWSRVGSKTAWRNLGVGVVAEHLAFNVWLLMSVIVVSLEGAGISFTVGQQFLLVILPNALGAILRIPYTFLFPRFGGRAWATISTSLLLIPCGMLAIAVTTGAPYWFFLITAATMGLGGATFSSSMANISFFFPDSKKGLALGLNAAGGNLGGAVVQLVAPLVISLGTGVNLVYAALMWMPLIVVSAICTWLFMDSLTSAKPDKSAYSRALKDKHTWIAAGLYVGAFGSFIGFSFAFPLLIKAGFVEYIGFVGLAFLGVAVSASFRPLGGLLADKFGGARITLLAFGAMSVGAMAAMVAVEEHVFGLFFGSFLYMFMITGIGNGAIFRMIPSICAAQARERAKREGQDLDEAVKSAKRQAAAVVGLTGSIGAFGGVLVNVVFKLSLGGGGSITPALVVFLLGYGVCMATTWWFYLRTKFAIARVPSLAYAGI